jgi:hypothetical protein
MDGERTVDQQTPEAVYDEKIMFLVTATGEIKCISNAIGQELDEQNMMLEDLAQNMDAVGGRLERYNERMRNLTHSKEGPN